MQTIRGILRKKVTNLNCAKRLFYDTRSCMYVSHFNRRTDFGTAWNLNVLPLMNKFKKLMDDYII